MRGRCDSFVVETEVHYPTGINLLWDALRTLIVGCGRVSGRPGLSGWRQWRYNLRQVKRLFRQVQKMKHSTSSDEHKQAQQEKKIRKAYQKYLDLASSLVARAEETRAALPAGEEELVREQLACFIQHAHRQIDQIQRRVLQGETIPHDEKVFSLFEPHTEWISKGKAGVPVELGLNVCILEDHYGYLLHHRVMQGETDETVAVPMVKETSDSLP